MIVFSRIIFICIITSSFILQAKSVTHTIPSEIIDKYLDHQDAIAILHLPSKKIIGIKNRKQLTSIHRPGSIFKLLGAAALLRNNIAEQPVQCNGTTVLFQSNYRCWLPKPGHGKLELLQALAESCNIYFFHRSQDMDPHMFLTIARQFGFGKTSPWHLAGEESGNIPSSLSKYEMPLAVVGDSDHIWVTGLQLLHLAAQLSGHPNYTVAAHDSDHVLRQAMRMVMMSGTGMYAHTSLPMAGKTGTARKINHWRYLGWFIGFVPFEKPLFAIVVYKHIGVGKEAAKLAANVLEQIIYPDINTK